MIREARTHLAPERGVWCKGTAQRVTQSARHSVERNDGRALQSLPLRARQLHPLGAPLRAASPAARRLRRRGDRRCPDWRREAPAVAQVVEQRAGALTLIIVAASTEVQREQVRCVDSARGARILERLDWPRALRVVEVVAIAAVRSDGAFERCGVARGVRSRCRRVVLSLQVREIEQRNRG